MAFGFFCHLLYDTPRLLEASQLYLLCATGILFDHRASMPSFSFFAWRGRFPALVVFTSWSFFLTRHLSKSFMNKNFGFLCSDSVSFVSQASDSEKSLHKFLSRDALIGRGALGHTETRLSLQQKILFVHLRFFVLHFKVLPGIIGEQTHGDINYEHSWLRQYFGLLNVCLKKVRNCWEPFFVFPGVPSLEIVHDRFTVPLERIFVKGSLPVVISRRRRSYFYSWTGCKPQRSVSIWLATVWDCQSLYRYQASCPDI